MWCLWIIVWLFIHNSLPDYRRFIQLFSLLMRIVSRTNIKWEVMDLNWAAEVQRFIIRRTKSRTFRFNNKMHQLWSSFCLHFSFCWLKLSSVSSRSCLKVIWFVLLFTSSYRWFLPCWVEILGGITRRGDRWLEGSVEFLTPEKGSAECTSDARHSLLAWALTMHSASTVQEQHQQHEIFTHVFVFTTISRAASYPLLAQFLDFSVFSFRFCWRWLFFFFSFTSQESQFSFNIRSVKMWKSFVPFARQKTEKKIS